MSRLIGSLILVAILLVHAGLIIVSAAFFGYILFWLAVIGLAGLAIAVIVYVLLRLFGIVHPPPK